ncbi:MAG: hypothetical protein RIS76_1822 [Verrucomicrobiota bacterium]
MSYLGFDRAFPEMSLARRNKEWRATLRRAIGGANKTEAKGRHQSTHTVHHGRVSSNGSGGNDRYIRIRIPNDCSYWPKAVESPSGPGSTVRISHGPSSPWSEYSNRCLNPRGTRLMIRTLRIASFTQSRTTTALTPPPGTA